MVRSLVVEQDHVDDVVDHLAEFEGLEHLRARRRGDLLTLESGAKDDPVPHTRFRRVGVHKWQLEMPTHTGRWQTTPIRAQLIELVDAVITQFGWMLAPIK